MTEPTLIVRSVGGTALVALAMAIVAATALDITLPINMAMPRSDEGAAEKATDTTRAPARGEKCMSLYQSYKDVCDYSQSTCTGITMCKEAISRFRDSAHCASKRTHYMEMCKWGERGDSWWRGHVDQIFARLGQGGRCLKVAIKACRGVPEATQALDKAKLVAEKLARRARVLR